MKREEKDQIIDNLKEKIENNSNFYIADISDLDATDTSDLRRACFNKQIELVVVKNTLLKQALEKSQGDYEQLYDALKGPTSVMFSEQASIPGKLIKEFRKKHDKPILKAAFIQESFYFGDEQIDALATIKSKEELIADIVLILQSPIKNVVSSLQSGGNVLTGVLQTLAERE